MRVSNLTWPTLRQEQGLYPEREDTNPNRQLTRNTQPGVVESIDIDVESDDDIEIVSGRSTNSFSKINFFQSRTLAQPSHHHPTFPQRSRRRSRSPSASSGHSEGDLTPASSEDVSYPELSTHITEVESSCLTKPPNSPLSYRSSIRISIQEEQDRRFAERIQQEENDTYGIAQSLFFEQPGTARQKPTPTRTKQKKIPFSNLKRVVAYRGTREDPIDLTSYSNDSGKSEIDLRSERLHPNASEVKKRDARLARVLQAEENRNRDNPSGSRDCAVCGESFLITRLPSLANCTHHPGTCAGCYLEWISTQLQGSSWREVKCPGSDCKMTLTYYEIQQYATREIFQQYDNFIARAAFNEDPKFRWCRACDFGQIHLSGEEGNIFTCASCGHKVCIVHENTWHEGETCEEYQYQFSGRKERDQRAQEEASLQTISKLSKKCPGPNCVYSIEKNDGCDHMTCSKCRYEFCWICLCDYNAVRRQGNSAHTANCKYHSRRLV